MSIPIDPHYIPAFSIEDVLLDKDSGAPMSGGLVYFYEDDDRTVLKPVYEITGTSPNYTFTQLPNPIVLSSIGTFEDALGNPTIPYFYPYTTIGNVLTVDLYFVAVFNSGMVPQFTREAVPYLPAGGGIGPVPGSGTALVNELSNPEFINILFNNSSPYAYSFSAAVQQEVPIAADWSLIVSCPTTGNVTVSQIAPQGNINVPGNPNTIMNITPDGGISAIRLRQRIYGSPNLWGSGYIAFTFVAKTYAITASTIDVIYSQSNGSVINEPILTALLLPGGAYQTFYGTLSIPTSTSSDQFPNAYVDIDFILPLSTEVDITCVMLSATGQNPVSNLTYEQTSLARQRDQLYHWDWPVVPIGSIIDFAGFRIPYHYLLCNGDSISRITYYNLFAALTLNLTATTVDSTHFTVLSTDGLGIGMVVEGLGIPYATTIIGISSLTIQLSQVTTISGTFTATFFAWGQGSASDMSLFNLPDFEGFVTAGAGGTLPPLDNFLGAEGGSATHAITIAEMPSHTHPPLSPATLFYIGTSGGTSNVSAGSAISVAGTTGPMGGDTPSTIVQPTKIVYKYIRYE